VSEIPEDALSELRARREAHTEGTPEMWDAAEVWITRSLALARPGGVVSVVLPDQKPFRVIKPQVTE